jgi:hypothetical protein
VGQLSEHLMGREGLRAIHILSHGSAGSLKLGSTQLNSATLEARQDELGAWRQALSVGGDILLYGCNVARGSFGVSFVERLAEVTGGDVAASTDLTGAVQLGGDWTLELTTGPIEASTVIDVSAANVFDHVLADIRGTVNGNDYFLISDSRISVKASATDFKDVGQDTPYSFTRNQSSIDIQGRGGNNNFVFLNRPSLPSNAKHWQLFCICAVCGCFWGIWR